MGQTLTKNFKFRFLNLLSPSLQLSLLRWLAKMPPNGGEIINYNQALDSIKKILVLLPRDRCETLILQKTLLALKHHYPAARLDILTTADHRELVQGNAAVDGGVFYQPADFFLFAKAFVELCEKIKAGQYHCCLNFSTRPDLLYSYLMGISDAPLRIGLQPASLRPFCNLGINPARNLTYFGDIANSLLRTLGIKIPDRLPWSIGKGLERNVKGLLAEAGASPEQPFCLLNLGAGRTGLEFTRDFLQKIAAGLPGTLPAPLVLLCPRAQRDRWLRLLRQEINSPLPLVAEDSIVSLSALLEWSVSVGTLNNSILHLALLLQKPCLGVLEQEEKDRWLDPGAGHCRWIFFSTIKNLAAPEFCQAWRILS
jgi:ADP-heptose:LPS heptosyltransferase